MAWFLFIDESGHDRVAAPYEVLAGIAVRDGDVWNLINDLHAAELQRFGRRYSSVAGEMKGKRLLKAKVFHHRALNTPVADDEVVSLATRALDCGAQAGVREWKALAIAKLQYVSDVFLLCGRYRCKVFASVIEIDAPATTSGGLRKDYGYLFERFFHFLDENEPREQGIVVFDELEKSQSHILIDQCRQYFRETAVGRMRAKLVIPEPFFVHSDLTTGIQIADLAAYIISWGFRIPTMTKKARPELAPFARQIADLRFRTTKQWDGEDHCLWSIAHIADLRTEREK